MRYYLLSSNKNSMSHLVFRCYKNKFKEMNTQNFNKQFFYRDRSSQDDRVAVAADSKQRKIQYAVN